MLTLSTKSAVRAAAFAALLFPVAMPRAGAQVMLTLMPGSGGTDVYTVTQGSTFVLDATLLNTDPVNSVTVGGYSLDTGALVQDVFAVTPPPASGDVFIDDGSYATPYANNLFYNNFYATFPASGGTATNASMFVFTFGTAVPTGPYNLDVTLNDANGNPLAQTMFTFNIQPATTGGGGGNVPEPGSALALLCGLLTTGGLIGRKRLAGTRRK